MIRIKLEALPTKSSDQTPAPSAICFAEDTGLHSGESVIEIVQMKIMNYWKCVTLSVRWACVLEQRPDVKCRLSHATM